MKLQRAIDMGCWFSVGPAMLRGSKGRRLVSSMPTDRVLTESDGPLARQRGRPLIPWDVREAEVVLGKLFDLSVSAVQRQLSLNLRHVSVHSNGSTWAEDSKEAGILPGVAWSQTFRRLNSS